MLVEIAAAQLKGRMIEEGNATFHRAIELAQKLPLRPNFSPGVRRPPTPLGVHYKDEAFKKILHAAIHAQAFQTANDAAGIWNKSGDNVGSAVVDAWLENGCREEAVAAARSIKDADSRVSALLNLAGNLLNEAGAPTF